MKYVVVFGTLAFALLFNATQVEAWPLKAILLSGFLCFGGVALAYGGVGAKAFLKTGNGRLSLLSWLIFWPYHSLNLFTLNLFRRKAGPKEDLFSQIDTNLWLGACLGNREAIEWGFGDFAVLDVAGELSENSIFRQSNRYLSLPTLDRCASSLDDLKRGAQWIALHQKDVPVYVHCALGHGRSATFVAAYLLQSGKAASVEESLTIIRTGRPSIDLSPSQIDLLQKLKTDITPPNLA